LFITEFAYYVSRPWPSCYVIHSSWIWMPWLDFDLCNHFDHKCSKCCVLVEQLCYRPADIDKW